MKAVNETNIFYLYRKKRVINLINLILDRDLYVCFAPFSMAILLQDKP